MKKNPQAQAPITLDALRAKLSASYHLNVDISGSDTLIEMRRLQPAQRAYVEEHLNKALPPIRDETADTPQYDVRNPEYLATKRRLEREARSLALYWAMPCLWENGACPPFSHEAVDVAAIHGRVQAQISSEEFQVHLFNQILGEQIGTPVLVNFTSASASVPG